MLNINIIVVGSLKEKFYKEAEAEFIKRLSSFCKISIVECPEASNLSGQQKINKEAELIMLKLKGTTIVCDIEGTLVTSENFAKLISDTMQTDSTISFVIGSSNGLSDIIKTLAKHKISFGRITLPHNLARIILEEQIYRAFTIMAGKSYHK